MTQSSGLERLSVIVPAFNEEEVLPAFHRRLVATLELLPFFCEIVYINDGQQGRHARNPTRHVGRA